MAETKKMLTEHEQKQQAWLQELDEKVESYYGKNIFLNVAAGRVETLNDLKKLLIKNVSDVEEDTHEYDSVIPLLRQACLDYEYMVKNGDNPRIFKDKYPMYIEFGDSENEFGGKETRRHGLIQVLV